MQQFIHTLTLSNARTGAEIRNAVEAVCHQRDQEPVVNEIYRNGPAFELGQVSGYPYEQFRLTPSPEDEVFLSAETYGQILVKDHRWPIPVYAIGYELESVVTAGVEFVNALTDHLNGENS